MTVLPETLRVAIVGDPHFYRENAEKARGGISHIRLGPSGEFLNSQPQQNPWSGLTALVDAEEIKADVLICVGDITFGADVIGLRKAWNELKALALQLNVKYLVCATGNHDVSSRSKAEIVAKNPAREMSAALGLFEPLKLLKPSYPVVEIVDGKFVDHRSFRTKYFGDSLVLVESDQYRIVVLNSCCEHGADSYQHERGSFPKSAEEALTYELEQANSEKINILVCHHPPEPHSEHNLGGHDFIENGEALLQCLERHGSWFIVHGHKHHGRISHAKGTSSAPIVFSAASLGIQLDLALEGMRNQFYIAEIKQRSWGALYGKISAWDFNVGTGWRYALRKTGGIFNGCGFGNRESLDEIAAQIAAMVPCDWTHAVEKLPNLDYLTPGDLNILAKRLSTRHRIVIQSDANGYWNELLQELK